MREKISQVEYDDDKYGFRQYDAPKKRLDLNDLLKRAKDQEKNDKKVSLLIFSGAASVAAVIFIILTLL